MQKSSFRSRYRAGAVGIVAILVVLGLAALPTQSLLTARADEPEPPVGTLTDFGVQQAALTVFESVMGPGKDGAPMMFSVQMGEPGVLSVIDPISREHVDTVPLPGSSGAWGITQASDGTVYAGSYSNAHLYSYDPQTGESEDLGAPVPGQGLIYGLKAGANGTIYGGTYPGAHAFSYSPTDGFTDYGPMYPGENYVRDTAIDVERQVLWAAIGSTSHLVRLDLTTGEKRDVLGAPYVGTSNSPYDLNLAGDRLFVKTSQGDAFVLDADTGEPVEMTNGATGEAGESFRMTSRGISPVSPDGSSVYYTSGRALYRYDLATDTFDVGPGPGGAQVDTGGGAGIGWGYVGDELYIKLGNYTGTAMRFNLTTGDQEVYLLPFPAQPIPINSVSAGDDGKVYVNYFINGEISSLDPADGTIAPVGRVGQTEGWAWHNGIAYLGVYPNGRVERYDPSKPFGADNPGELFQLQADHGQNRPFALVPTDDTLYAGSTPDYGLHGGALSVYDLASGDLTVHRDIVTDQGVTALALSGTTLWGGTSIAGGGGTNPRATEAKLFSFDTDSGQKVAEYVPVPGARTISAVAAGADGTIWGLADSTLFRFDPESGTVLRSTELPAGGSNVWDALEINSDEHLYAAVGSTLLRIDPLSWEVTKLASDVSRMAPGHDGELWLRGGANRVVRYTPPADACADSDVRTEVIVADEGSGVDNRFVADGCTISDLVDADGDWDSHETFLDHVAAVTRQLRDDGVITATERSAIISAAGRSDVG